MDYFDLGTNIQALVNTLYDENAAQQAESAHSYPSLCEKRTPIDKSFYQVRQSVCVAGVNGDAIREVKGRIAGLLKDPVALESFHVRNPEDVKDGAFLVPKVVLVASHCPGKKVIDDDGDDGQLDRLYDEACEVGADIMLIYMGLPHSLYPPMTHIIYHPRIVDMVFPDQPLLRHLAADNCFLTICDGCDLNALQKNLLREWLVRPIDDNHPVYHTADQLCETAEKKRSLAAAPPPSRPAVIDVTDPEVGYAPATEEHPLAEKRGKKKKRFGFKSRKRGDPKPAGAKRQAHENKGLAPVHEGMEDDGLEMDMYRSESTAIPMEGGGTAVF